MANQPKGWDAKLPTCHPKGLWLRDNRRSDINIRWVYFQFILSCLSGLLLFTACANAGNFRSFILGGESENSSQKSVYFSANSKSASCIECHDGRSAINVSLKHADTAMRFTNHGSSDHPVGMYYDSYARKSPFSYISAAKLDPRIKLENGQVTCISCHETSPQKVAVALVSELNMTVENCSSTKALTTGSDHTGLCMSCHSM